MTGPPCVPLGVPGEARVAKIVTQGIQMVPKSDPKKTKFGDSVFLSVVLTMESRLGLAEKKGGHAVFCSVFFHREIRQTPPL